MAAPTIFRQDLDATHQRNAVREARQRLQHELAMDDWRTTRASRADHRIMLRILVAEAVAQNPRGVGSDVGRQLLCSIDGMMDGADNYAAAVGHLAKLRLFVPPPPTPPSSKANESFTSSCNISTGAVDAW